ncbi:putative 28S ribosomal protein S25, mitochondrial [Chionoecetes opilio]|uniref:Small ribosomal subunit protein mS25 n=1 Tax=Chionoecetes opilio TaxID=41210 RepID=A0A8J5D463_CHIOP|nr:putative 28S ribosomal protein S25, mitochondrial [Chionoecetes opilio]
MSRLDFSVNYNVHGEHHRGAKEFVFWHLAQLQYNNPHVQVATFKNLTPTPFIRVFFESGEEALVDVDSRPRQEIQDHIKRVFCKTDAKLAEETRERESKDNPANFGWGCDRQCLCEVSGQLPCPGVVPLPKVMRGRYINGQIVE